VSAPIAASWGSNISTVTARHPKLFGSTIFLVNLLAALSVCQVWIAEMFVIGGILFSFVGLFLPILGLGQIVGAFFAWSKNFAMSVSVAVVSALIVLFTLGVLSEEHHATHAQKLYPLQVNYFLLIPLSIQLLSVFFSTYKLVQFRLEVTPWPH